MKKMDGKFGLQIQMKKTNEKIRLINWINKLDEKNK